MWTTPVTSWVCSGETQGCGQSLIPPYAGAPLVVPWWTAGSAVSIPMPPGTGSWRPFTNTSRWAWTWNVRNSCVVGVSPACRTSLRGSAGRGHGAAPARGVGAGGAEYPGATVPLPPQLGSATGPKARTITTTHVDPLPLALRNADLPPVGPSSLARTARLGESAGGSRRDALWIESPRCVPTLLG